MRKMLRRLAGMVVKAMVCAAVTLVMCGSFPISARAAESMTVSFCPDAVRMDISDLDGETRALLESLCRDYQVLIVPEGFSQNIVGMRVNSYRSYQQLMDKLERTGYVDMIASQAERRVNAPVNAFLYSFSWMQSDLRAEVFGDNAVDAAIVQLVAEAGVVEGMEQHEAAARLYQAVKNHIAYDDAWVRASVAESFAAGRGVCRHYASLFQYACRYCGIPCAKVISGSHMWNVTRIGEAVEYTDILADGLLLTKEAMYQKNRRQVLAEGVIG